MIRNAPLIAVIPVRAGSKAVPGKNLYSFLGHSLLERAILMAKLAPSIDRVIVTTDSEEMQSIASRHGVALPELRPAGLASDDACSVDVVRHALDSAGIGDGHVILLQVTSPLRTVEDVESACSQYETRPEVEAVVSVTRHDGPHPEKILRIVDGFLRPYLGNDPGVARQTLPPVLALNGAIYLISVEVIRQLNTFLPGATIPYLMPPERSINIDTQMDLVLLEALTERGLVIPERYE